MVIKDYVKLLTIFGNNENQLKTSSILDKLEILSAKLFVHFLSLQNKFIMQSNWDYIHLQTFEEPLY